MHQSPWARPIHLLSVPRHSFVIRFPDFDITPLLANLAFGSDANRAAIGEGGGIDVIVAAMRAHREDASLQVSEMGTPIISNVFVADIGMTPPSLFRALVVRL